MDLHEYTVVVPRKANTTKEETALTVWPYVKQALDDIDADPSTRDAAEAAFASSDGAATLANYLNSQAKRIHKADYDFKVPLIVHAAQLARDDGGAETIYDPDEGAIYFETDEHQFSFHVFKDWTVEWERVADRVETDYPWDGMERQVWALDWLMDYMEVPLDQYLASDDEEEG